MVEKKYLDLEGLCHYDEKMKDTVVLKENKITNNEIDILLQNIKNNISTEDKYEIKVEKNEIVLINKTTLEKYKLPLEKDSQRVVSLSKDTQFSSDNIVIETIDTPEYLEEKDLNLYLDYNLTSPGWYIFARINAKKNINVTNTFSISGVAGYKKPSIGATFVDVAIQFDVLAKSQLITINWGESSENFIFKATDLAVRNLDYRVTFYLYSIDDYTTWNYELTTDSAFLTNQKYYIKNDNEYILANVTIGDNIPADTYYVHSGVTFKDFVKNVSYCCDYIDCPVTIYLPEVDDENYGAWFEIQTQFDVARSITIVPSDGTKVSGTGVATPKAGINIINFQFHKPTKTWLPTITNWAISSN